MIVFLPVCAFEVYWCLLYAVLMSASTGPCSKPCSLCKEIQHPDIMVCILLHILYLTCKARSSRHLLSEAVDFSQQTVPMSCYSWSNYTSPTHKSCWSTHMSRWWYQKRHPAKTASMLQKTPTFYVAILKVLPRSSAHVRWHVFDV